MLSHPPTPRCSGSYLSFILLPPMNLDALFPYFSVLITRTTVPQCLERAEFINDPQHILANLLKSVLRAVVTSNHLLAPLHWIFSHESNKTSPRVLDSPASRRVYYVVHAEVLVQIREELAYRFARAPTSVLVVKTNHSRWAAVSACSGLENTILVEQRLIDIVLAGTPEGRLFGFAIFYHELSHLFRTWVGCSPFFHRKSNLIFYSICMRKKSACLHRRRFTLWAGR
jgi:hypothetical protein